MDLKRKVALITGGSSGIGKAIALALAKENVSVALVARTKTRLEEVQEEIEAYGEIPVSLEESCTKAITEEIITKGKKAIICPCDIKDSNSVMKAINEAVDVFGHIDIIINNAGLGIFKPVEEIEEEEWDTVLETVLKGTFLVTKFALPHLYKQKRGHIINIASLWSKKFCKECSAYTAAKYGVRGFSDSLREEAREHNVKVSTIMPGTVATPFFENGEWKDFDPAAALKPEDVAKAVVDVLKYSDNAVVEEIVVQTIKPKY